MITDSCVALRLAGLDDLEGIGSLLPALAGPSFDERFPAQTPIDFCRWKYFRNPLGDAAVGIAMDGRRVVSIVAGVPKRVMVGTETLLAFELGDFITAPTHRKRGYFSRLVNTVCDEALKRGATFAYVRPNSNSLPILAQNLNFLEVRKIDGRHYVIPSNAVHRKLGIPPSLTRALGLDWLARTLMLPHSDFSITVKRETRFSRELDWFWDSVHSSYSFALVRDSSYLNWRYADCPTPYQIWIAYRGEQIAGYAAGFFSPAESAGHVVDLFTNPEDGPASAALLRVVMESMLAQGAVSIHAWTLQSGACSAGVRNLQRACPRDEPPPLCMAIRFLSSSFNASSLPAMGWQLASGDFDGI